VGGVRGVLVFFGGGVGGYHLFFAGGRALRVVL